MGHKKAGVPSRRYTSEFKIEAVKLGHSVGMSEASRRLGIPDLSLFNWVRLERKGKLGTSADVSATPRSAKELEAEVDRLRRELASAKVDNEILKKAAAYFAKESR
jgi:transposase